MTERSFFRAPTVDDPAPNIPRSIFEPHRLVEVCKRCRFEEDERKRPPASTMWMEIDREIVDGLMRQVLAHTCRLRRAG